MQTVTATADAVVGAADHVVADLAPAVDSVLQIATSTTDALTGLVGSAAADIAPTVDGALQTVTATADAVAGAADHVVADLAPAVDSVLQIATTTTDALTGLVGSAADIAPTVDGALQTVTATADSVAAAAGGAADGAPAVDPLLQSAGEAAHGVVGAVDHVAAEAAPAVDAIPAALAAVTGLVGDMPPPIDAAPASADSATTLETASHSAAHETDPASLAPTISALAPDATNDVLGASEPQAPAHADAIATAPDLHAQSLLSVAHDALGSGGTIAIADQPPSATATDDLFAAGQYTDYGVNLSNDVTPATTGVAPTLDPAAAEPTAGVDIVHHGATSQSVAPDDLQHQPLIHGLDDLAVRVGDSLL
jgi:hypothetical protein